MRLPETFSPEALDHLRRLPFITDLRSTREHGLRDKGYDGKLEIQTPSGSFELVAKIQRDSLSQSSVNALVAWADRFTKEGQQPVILFARYVTRSVAEDLIRHQVNFVDRVGNIYLALGSAHYAKVLGERNEKSPVETRVTPAQLKLLFGFATTRDSINLPVRELETAAGISKSNVAQVRQQLIAQGLLVAQGRKYTLGRHSLISERLVSGYSQTLRPRLFQGRFRYPEKAAEPFLNRLQTQAAAQSIRYALTGGPAADLLQHFYCGAEIPLFITPWTRSTAQHLRLLPDREGPVTLLRAFGQTVFWHEEGSHMIAPPWLIYAELLNATDPRAHEAAEEFRRGFLK